VIILLIYSQSHDHTLHFINISWVFVWDNSRTCKNQGGCHSVTHNLLYHHITLFSLYEINQLNFLFKAFYEVISTWTYISWLFSLFFLLGFWGVLLDIHIYISKMLNRYLEEIKGGWSSLDSIKGGGVTKKRSDDLIHPSQG
jgi:hypothetical protein